MQERETRIIIQNDIECNTTTDLETNVMEIDDLTFKESKT